MIGPWNLEAPLLSSQTHNFEHLAPQSSVPLMTGAVVQGIDPKSLVLYLIWALEVWTQKRLAIGFWILGLFSSVSL